VRRQFRCTEGSPFRVSFTLHHNLACYTCHNNSVSIFKLWVLTHTWRVASCCLSFAVPERLELVILSHLVIPNRVTYCCDIVMSRFKPSPHQKLVLSHQKSWTLRERFLCTGTSFIHNSFTIGYIISSNILSKTLNPNYSITYWLQPCWHQRLILSWNTNFVRSGNNWHSYYHYWCVSVFYLSLW